MIINDTQYAFTQKQIKMLQESIEKIKNFKGNKEMRKPTPLEMELMVAGIRSQILELEQELKIYQKLKS